MSKEELIDLVEKALYNADFECNPALVNFVDDEIYWNLIAKVAVTTVLEAQDDSASN